MKPSFMILVLSATLAACGPMPHDLGENDDATVQGLDVGAGCPDGLVAQLDPSSGQVVCVEGDSVPAPDGTQDVASNCPQGTTPYVTAEGELLCITAVSVGQPKIMGRYPVVTAEGEPVSGTSLVPKHKGTSQTDLSGGSDD